MKEMKNWSRILLRGSILALFVFGIRWILPAMLPFLVGLLVALTAEPLTGLLRDRMRLPRGLATGISITAAYGLLLLALYWLGRLAVREMDLLAQRLPALMERMDETAGQVEKLLLQAAQRAPERLRGALTENIRSLLSDGSALVQGFSGRVLNMASRMIVSLPDALVFLGTAVTSGFLISARLPRLREMLHGRLNGAFGGRVVLTLHNLRVNLLGFLRAQGKLMGLTFCILTMGFFILRIKHALIPAALTALVDALPMLGTGTVLIPWGLLAFLQGNHALALGLLALYGLCTLCRSMLEPRFLGRQLGLSPLLTLGAVYLGYRFWGILGMILAPVLGVTVMDLWDMGREVA